jgi:glutamate-1-semialdehyde 2,1-aminomutase
MNHLMPVGDCQHSGTYNGHPVVVAAGIAAIKAYREPGFYDHIGVLHQRLLGGLRTALARYNVTARVQGLGARFGIYFGIAPDQPVTNYAEALAHDKTQLLRFYALAIKHGVYFHDYGGAPCHHGFCATMTTTDVDEALARLDRAIAELSA